MKRSLLQPPVWLRRAAAVLVVLEGFYVAGLIVVLGFVADGSAAMDGRDTSRLLQPVSWGVALTVAVAMTASAVVMWVHPRFTNPLTRLLLAAVAGLHVLVLVGALFGLAAVVIGGMSSEEPGLDALWYLLASAVAAAVASSAAPVAMHAKPG